MEINISSTTITNYRDLMKTIQTMLIASWGKDKVRFTSAYPKKADAANIKPPIITYSVVSKRPGQFGDEKEIKPRLRDTIALENEEGNQFGVELYGQMFDYMVLFELWAEDGDSADELAEKFQRFMSQYTGAFKKAGVSEMIFQGMDGNEGSAEWRTDLIRRNIMYQFRIDEIVGIKCPMVDDVIIDSLIHKTQYRMIFSLAERSVETDIKDSE